MKGINVCNKGLDVNVSSQPVYWILQKPQCCGDLPFYVFSALASSDTPIKYYSALLHLVLVAPFGLLDFREICTVYRDFEAFCIDIFLLRPFFAGMVLSPINENKAFWNKLWLEVDTVFNCLVKDFTHLA